MTPQTSVKSPATRRLPVAGAIGVVLATTLLGILNLSAASSGTASALSTAVNYGDPAFEQLWNRTDKAVHDRVVARSWMWGPEPFYTAYEPYAEGPAGQHIVTYFDKSRMEINDPSADRSSQWFVTNGLLVVEMISGRLQTGDNAFISLAGATLPVAGDPATSLNAPTYASLARIASLKGDNRAPNRVGQSIREGLGRTDGPGIVDSLASYARYGTYEPTLGHNIADVFWKFLNQKGLVYRGGQYLPEEDLVNWVFAMGYPITEPYWIEIKVGTQNRWVLMQAFQRRILTYSPHNPEGWKVEMGNVGRTYFEWRYGQLGQPGPGPTVVVPSLPTPTRTPTPVPPARASITIDPDKGMINTQVMIHGKHFPAHSAVTIGIEKPSANYYRGITTMAARADGSFEVRITLPSDAAQLGELTVTASANGGGVRAEQSFRIVYNPIVEVTPSEVVVNGSVRVRVAGFPARARVGLGLQYRHGSTEWLTSVDANSDGGLDVTLPITHKQAGTQFWIAAAADPGIKATSKNLVTVIAQPSVRVEPANGPTGVHVTFQGTNWPAHRTVLTGIKVANSHSEGWFPNPVVTDAQGNFTTSIWIGNEYAPYSEIRLLASDAVSAIRVEGSYYIVRSQPPTPTATPVPSSPEISVSPNAVAVGQVATVHGRRWPAGAQVSIGLGRGGIEESVGVANADGNGNFSHGFVLTNRWQNAGQLTLTAVVAGGPSAVAQLWVAPQNGRIVPSGLPMNVYSLQHKSGPRTYKINADGWQPGSIVSISVISADGSMNAQVATTTVAHDGRVQASFGGNPGWHGRSDLGVRAATADGRYISVRYLPGTEIAKVDGTSNTYQLTGQNWSGNTRIIVVLRVDGETEEVIGSTTSDVIGQFNLQVNLPRIPASTKNEIEVRATDQPYAAWFDF